MHRRSVIPFLNRMLVVVVVVFGSAAMGHAGPVSPLYVSTGTEIQVMQGNSIVDSWTTGDQEYALAVDTTVRTWSQGNTFISLLGREYALDGTPTGATYINAVGCCFRDGTTDGQFNYAVRATTPVNTVYRFNLDWTDPQVMPFPPHLLSGVTGITYDSSDDTFWLGSGSISNFISVLHVTRAGDLLSFIGGVTGNNVSLAYDASDDTLWIYSARPFLSELVQFLASDDMTQTKFPISRQPGIGFVTGIEFQLQHSIAAVPEPATAGLLATGLAVLLSLRARKRIRRS